MSATPRLVIAAPASGHGKTAVAVGVIAALRARGVRPAAFKIGPDHVDAAYLGCAAGTPGRSLDPQLLGSAGLAPLLGYGTRGRDLAVIEGTMGLFDGLAGSIDTESTAQIAGVLRAPVVLVVDVATMGQSAAALLHGFRTYDEMLWLGGVILNRVSSDRHERVLRDAIADLGIPVLGALRHGQLAAAALPPRAAGVVPVLHATMEATSAIRRLGEVVTAQVDLDRLVALGRSAPVLATPDWAPTEVVGTAERTLGLPMAGSAPGPGAVGPVDGALALVENPDGPLVAVCGTSHGDYDYPETRELLVAAGARVLTVDPLRDSGLPAGVHGLVLGDGLPEGYLEEIAANVPFLRSVAALAGSGAPVVAGPAGLAILATEHAGRPMAGVLATSTRLGERRVLGYRDATAAGDSVLWAAGEQVSGYKQHRGMATPRAGASPAWHWAGGSPEGFVRGGVHASFLTVHWAGAPHVAARFVIAARRLATARTPAAA
jgi:cobyrinic acid a,c-diamide synthase